MDTVVAGVLEEVVGPGMPVENAAAEGGVKQNGEVECAVGAVVASAEVENVGVGNDGSGDAGAGNVVLGEDEDVEDGDVEPAGVVVENVGPLDAGA